MSFKHLRKTVSVLIILAFFFTNINTSYAAPGSKSLFKNKKVDYDKLSNERQDSLEKKQSIIKGEDAKEVQSQKKEAKKILSSHLEDISQIHIPQELGRITEVYNNASSSDKKSNLIVHIQDLHTNPEAELNLAKILELLLKDYNMSLVCSEGADGKVDTSLVSSFPDSQAKEKVSRIFIDSGELTGEEYLSITKYPNLPIWGIEDEKIYFQNIADFNNIMKFKTSSQIFISQAKKALEQLKPKICSKEMMSLYQKESDYENKKIETDAYLKYLSAYIQKFNLSTASYKNISLLTETMVKEKTIDQLKIMKDYQNLFLNLQSTLQSRSLNNDLDSLVARANLFKDQKISPFSFYSYLKDLANKHLKEGFAAKYPELDSFVDYLAKVNLLDSTKLFIEMENLSYDIKTNLARNAEEKTLVSSLRNIKFLESFFNLKVSNEELDYYLNNKDSHKVEFFEKFLKPAMTKYDISVAIDYNPDLIDGHFQELEDFYKVVKDRDVAMVNKSISEIEKRNSKVSALIAGGFHTKGITKLLRERGYSYIVVSPYSKTDIDEENYHFLLSGKRKPLAEILSKLDVPNMLKRYVKTLRVPLIFSGLAEKLEAYLGVDSGKAISIRGRLVAALQIGFGGGSVELKKPAEGILVARYTSKEGSPQYYKITTERVTVANATDFTGDTVYSGTQHVQAAEERIADIGRGSIWGVLNTFARLGIKSGDEITVLGIQPERLKDAGKAWSESSVRREFADAENLGIIKRMGTKDKNGKEMFKILISFTKEELDSLSVEARKMLDRGRIKGEEIAKIKQAINDIKRVKLTPVEIMGELKFAMDILGLKEDSRTLGILKNSLDPVAFVEILTKESGKPVDKVLDILMQIPALKVKALKYKVRKAIIERRLNAAESTCGFLRIDVTADGSRISRDSNLQELMPGQLLSDLLLEQYRSAETTSFVYRDDMVQYVGRFIGLASEKPEVFSRGKINDQELSDLQEEINKLKGFLKGELGKGKKMDLAKIVNLVNNGIGANEMYLHQLAQAINQLAKNLGVVFHWEVVDNPADFERVVRNSINATTDNTLAFDESRSGTTTEPADFMEMTCKRNAGLYINKRIIWANGERFHKLGEQLVEGDPSSSVLHIDNTPGNIGGRHMNLKTGMVYSPLFTALSIIGYKMFDNEDQALDWASEQLKIYVTNLYNVNNELTPKQRDLQKAMYNPSSQIATEMVRKRDVEGRVKLAMIFDPGLRHFATEYYQNTNEGIAKPAKGNERNNNMHSFWDASDENIDYMAVFSAKPELYQPIFIVDLSSNYADKMLKEAHALKEKGIPVKVVTLGLKKIETGDSLDVIKAKFAHNLAVQTQATALLQTVVTTFTHLTDQDANSNPAVKMTREITAAIQDILVEREAVKGSSLTEEETRITLKQIVEKMAQAKEKDRRKAGEDLDTKISAVKARGTTVLPDVFNEFVEGTLKPLARNLGVKEEIIVDIFIGAVSRIVLSADLAESGGLKSALVDVALESIKSGERLGALTRDFSLSPLSKQVDVYKDPENGLVVSLACPENLSSLQEKSYKDQSKEKLAQVIADYYYDRYQEEGRANTLNTIGVAYVDADTGNANIKAIMEKVNSQLRAFGINSLPMNFPRIAHTGIEAAQALAEIIAIIGLIPTQSFPEGEGQLGSVEIKKGLTVNGANKIYIMSNVARMALGGSPTLIVEYRNKEQLGEIREIMIRALGILADKLSGASKPRSLGAAAEGELERLFSRKQQVDSMDQIVAVDAANVIADKEKFESWIARQPENIAVVIIAMSDAEYESVKQYENIAFIKVFGRDIKGDENRLALLAMFGEFGTPEFFGGFKLGAPAAIDQYKTVVGAIAEGV